MIAVLHSGGQDSTTVLCDVVSKVGAGNVVALFATYGQRHEGAEANASEEICHLLGVRREVVDLRGLLDGGALLDHGAEVRAQGGFEDDQCPGGLPTTYVPMRNMILLTVAASVAVRHGADTLAIGVCLGDAGGYPDTRPEFIDAAGIAINFALPSSLRPFLIYAPLVNMTKAETVELAVGLGSRAMEALGMSVTCYNGQVPACGECPACILRAEGFEQVGIEDPARKRHAT